MNTRDQFGNYLLLKKLAEDALGETFRAGRIGRQGVERVVLLRVLNGPGFDAERLARALQTRSGLAQALKSPNIGGAIDVGQVRGVPYVVYDYNAGRSLAQLMEQAARRHSPMPLDHALLIAERIALALGVANETRMGDDRVQHGFVTPLLVQVSNEGELRLLGFEASSGLRESAAHPIVKQAVGRYLAPETLAGQPAHRSDDVYSVGAILLELITGQTLPSPASLAAAIDAAIVEADGTPLPAELAALLRRTLCPRDQRVGDAVAWHKSLAKLMADGGYAATTFNLAFFLHNLFRDEIDREAREIESEKAQAASMAATVAATPRPAEVAPAPAPAAAAPSPVRASGPVREDTNVLRAEYGIPEAGKKGGNPAVMIAAGVGAVAVLAIGGYLLFGRGGSTAPAPAAPATDAGSAPAAAPAQTGMTPEQIQAMIQEALANQKKQSESEQRASEEKLKALQKQLEDAQKVRAAAAAAPAPAPALGRTTEPAQQAAVPAPSAAAAPPPSAASTAGPAAQPAVQPAAPAPVASAPVAAPQPAAVAAGATRAGDLVTMGPGVTPPRLVRQPPLQYPPVAKRLKKEATVTVRVLVDENGRPVNIESVGANVGFGMEEAAQAYARNCLWEPAKKGGVAVKIWWELRVAFKL